MKNTSLKNSVQLVANTEFDKYLEELPGIKLKTQNQLKAQHKKIL